MEDEFIKKINDLYNRSRNKGILTYTGFITPTEKRITEEGFSKERIRFFGGVKNCERVRAFFLPEYIDEINENEYITAFHAKFSFEKLSHRDFLGAILGLGIKRECIGDIYVFDKEAYFFASKEIAKFIKANLDKVGAIGIKFSEIPFSEVKEPELKFEEVKFTVQSLRLDSICSGIFRQSREKMNLNIREGFVSLNYLQCKNTSEEIKAGDIISIKGFGKAKVSEIRGKSKSGKIFVNTVIYK